MKVINLADSRRRNTRVALESQSSKTRVQYRAPDNTPVTSVRLIKGSLETDLDTLTRDAPLEALSQALIDGDPELDIELFGKRVMDSSRVYLDPDHRPAYNVIVKELVYTREGELKETRDLQTREANINTDIPIKWSGKLLPKRQFAKKMAFVHCYRVSHVDGLTFDFLFEMARELAEKDAFLLLAAGTKMNEPLILTRNGAPYRAFLEGRIKEDKYLLLLHLSNLEIKPVEESAS